jgi:ABC-type branched-subunit amino acid transport system substrate-binding protein
MVLEKDVRVINLLGGAETDAIAPFCEENNVVYMPLMQDTMPSRPLCVVGEANSKGDPLRARYLKETYPDIQTVAIVSQDDPVGRITNAFEIGAWEAMGVEVVYEEYISTETVDFAPIVSAMMEHHPDVLSWGCSWPDFDCFLDEQAYLQGFDGYICSNFVVTDCVASKVDHDWMQARLCIDGYPDIDDPWFGEGSKQWAFYDEWQAKYGPGAPEDVGFPMDAIAWDYMVTCEPYIRSMAGAGTTDPHQVLAWMKDPANWPLQTILGDAVMSGTSQFGIDNQITPPLFLTAEIQVDGVMKKRIVVQYDDYLDWFEANKEVIMAAVRARGVAWDQRQ